MPERTPYIAANWKMHKTVAEAAEFVDALLPRIAATQSDVVICPPFTALTAVVERRYGTAVKVAAQNMHEEDSGAFTGEVSAPMLVELDVEAVVLGHSERRQYFNETDEALARKVAAGARPPTSSRSSASGRARRRATPARPRKCWSASCRPTSAASRPGRSRTSSSPTSRSGRSAPAAPPPPSRPRRRAPSSATCCAPAAPPPTRSASSTAARSSPANAAELLSLPDVDGALVGGASLDAEDFAAIVEAAG